ncbi:MAG: hypothetical protein IPF99_30155 [Deltaproteobacteria bacterium]|nr:hypothetical protein [Deltaproteobacteria bacterium]
MQTARPFRVASAPGARRRPWAAVHHSAGLTAGGRVSRTSQRTLMAAGFAPSQSEPVEHPAG